MLPNRQGSKVQGLPTRMLSLRFHRTRRPQTQLGRRIVRM